MKILIFNNRNEKIIQEIQTALKTFQNCQIIVTKDYPMFKTQLSLCLSGETIVVFFITKEKDMAFLESMQNNFMDIKLIINQPKGEKSFQSRAFKLYPRIITNCEENSELLLSAVQGISKEILKNQFKRKIV